MIEPEQQSDNSENPNEAILGNNYEIGNKIGSGSFGEMRIGKKVSTGESVAIKLEPIDHKHPQLEVEHRHYQSMGEEKGIPKVHYFGRWNNYNALVLELLGKSLEDVFDMCDRKFSLKTIIYITLQLLKRIESVHNRNIVYRDIKTENFLLGLRTSPKPNLIRIIDFGLAKEYIVSGTNEHIPMQERDYITGTARYMSISANCGREHGRRDDMESIAHLIIYLLRDGSLPWMGLTAKNTKEKFKKICEVKQNTSIKTLCQGFPEEFGNFLKYCRKLEFEAKPNYEGLKNMFISLFEREKFKDDGVYDWDLKDFDWSLDTNQTDQNDETKATQLKRKISNLKLVHQQLN